MDEATFFSLINQVISSLTRKAIKRVEVMIGSIEFSNGFYTVARIEIGNFFSKSHSSKLKKNGHWYGLTRGQNSKDKDQVLKAIMTKFRFPQGLVIA